MPVTTTYPTAEALAAKKKRDEEARKKRQAPVGQPTPMPQVKTETPGWAANYPELYTGRPTDPITSGAGGNIIMGTHTPEQQQQRFKQFRDIYREAGYAPSVELLNTLARSTAGIGSEAKRIAAGSYIGGNVQGKEGLIGGQPWSRFAIQPEVSPTYKEFTEQYTALKGATTPTPPEEFVSKPTYDIAAVQTNITQAGAEKKIAYDEMVGLQKRMYEEELEKSGAPDIKNQITTIDQEITARKTSRDTALLDESGKPIPQWMITGRKALEMQSATGDLNRLIDQRNNLANQYNAAVEEATKKAGYGIKDAETKYNYWATEEARLTGQMQDYQSLLTAELGRGEEAARWEMEFAQKLVEAETGRGAIEEEQRRYETEQERLTKEATEGTRRWEAEYGLAAAESAYALGKPYYKATTGGGGGGTTGPDRFTKTQIAKIKAAGKDPATISDAEAGVILGWTKEGGGDRTSTQLRAAEKEMEQLGVTIVNYLGQWAQYGDEGLGTREEALIRPAMDKYKNLTLSEIKNAVYGTVTNEWLESNKQKQEQGGINWGALKASAPSFVKSLFGW